LQEIAGFWLVFHKKRMYTRKNLTKSIERQLEVSMRLGKSVCVLASGQFLRPFTLVSR